VSIAGERKSALARFLVFPARSESVEFGMREESAVVVSFRQSRRHSQRVTNCSVVRLHVGHKRALVNLR